MPEEIDRRAVQRLLAEGAPLVDVLPEKEYAQGAGMLAKRDVPTCRLTDTVGGIRERIEGTGWDVCVVANDERVVLGLLGEDELAADRQIAVETAMESGPSTWRLNGALADIARYMRRHHVRDVAITTSEGRLHGVIRHADVPKE